MSIHPQTMRDRIDSLKSMRRALDEVTEAVTVLLNEYDHALDEQVEPWWPNFQSEALRATLSDWSIWVPELRAIDHLTNKATNENEEA